MWGADLGVRSVHLFCAGENPWAISIDVERMSNRADELDALWNKVYEVFSSHDVVFVEEPPLAGVRNIRTFAALSQVFAVVLTAAPKAYGVEVSTWKKQVVGKGNATKEEVQGWLTANNPAYAALCGDQNLTDAACVALYGHAVLDRL